MSIADAKLDDAVDEAKRFIKFAERFKKDRAKKDADGAPTHSLASRAAVERASLDLTRALAALRRVR